MRSVKTVWRTWACMGLPLMLAQGAALAQTQDNFGAGYSDQSWLVGNSSFGSTVFSLGVVFTFEGPTGSTLDSVSVPLRYVEGRPFAVLTLVQRSTNIPLAGSMLNDQNAQPGAFGASVYTLDRQLPSSCQAFVFLDGCFNPSLTTLTQGEQYVVYVAPPPADGNPFPNAWGWQRNGDGAPGEWLVSANGGAFGSIFGADLPAYRISYTSPVPEPASWALWALGLWAVARGSRKARP